MTWFDRHADHSAGERLGALLRTPGILRVPGAHNALAALLAKKAGFKTLYLSGAALSASLGLPDLGILGLDELVFFAKIICRATELPLIVDADTGYGGVLNVMRAVRELEDAGAAALQIEDQILPKKCGHLNDKRLVAPEEMAAKVAAAAQARRQLKIIARTDAVAVEGIEAALARARLYIQAGADIIFPEALTSEAMFRTFAREINTPLLANMTEFGQTPYFTAAQFESFGYKLVTWPVSSLRIAGKAIAELYQHLAAADGAAAMLERMQTRAELYETIGYTDYEQLDATVARSVVPPDLRDKNLD
ncbi:MAG: methylisocitrate lyase [Candidatus Binataceae bacterium]